MGFYLKVDLQITLKMKVKIIVKVIVQSAPSFPIISVLNIFLFNRDVSSYLAVLKWVTLYKDKFEKNK